MTNKKNRYLLGKYKDLFDGTLDNFDTKPIKFEVKEDMIPIHS